MPPAKTMPQVKVEVGRKVGDLRGVAVGCYVEVVLGGRGKEGGLSAFARAGVRRRPGLEKPAAA